MRNSIKKLLSVVMALVLLLAFFAGCGDAREGNLKTTPSVNEGANPEYFGSDKKENNGIPFETEAKIKQVYCESLKRFNVTVDDITVEFVAEMNGAYAVFLDVSRFDHIDAVTYDIVNGFVFSYPSGRNMKIYRDGTIYEIPEAYAAGAVGNEELRILHKAYYEPSEEKIYCEATLYETFDDNEIIVTVKHYNCYDVYSADSFADVGCIDLESGLYSDPTAKIHTRILHLTLSEHSKENVLNVIKKLEKRDDVYKAEPLYRAVDVENAPLDPDTISVEKKTEIEYAWLAKYGKNLFWYESSDDAIYRNCAVRNYGTFNGLTVLFNAYAIYMDELNILKVGGEDFRQMSPFDIWVYKDGEFIALADAYGSGLLTEYQLAVIAEYHRQFQKQEYQIVQE